MEKHCYICYDEKIPIDHESLPAINKVCLAVGKALDSLFNNELNDISFKEDSVVMFNNIYGMVFICPYDESKQQNLIENVCSRTKEKIQDNNIWCICGVSLCVSNPADDSFALNVSFQALTAKDYRIIIEKKNLTISEFDKLYTACDETGKAMVNMLSSDFPGNFIKLDWIPGQTYPDRYCQGVAFNYHGEPDRLNTNIQNVCLSVKKTIEEKQFKNVSEIEFLASRNEDGIDTINVAFKGETDSA